MDFSSPKLMKNIENFFSGSPQSPSFLPLVRRQKVKDTETKSKMTISSKNISRTLSDSFESPTATLAAHLSENFHIQE